MKILLLAGYRPTDENYTAQCQQLNQQLQGLRALSYSVAVVLAGEHADQMLRQCRQLAMCELIFDTNDRSATIMTNVRAGLHISEQEIFIHPMDVPLPRPEVWAQIRNLQLALEEQSPVHAVQITNGDGSLFNSGFPILLTRQGNELLRTVIDIQSLADQRLHYHHVACENLPTTENTPRLDAQKRRPLIFGASDEQKTGS